MYRSVTFNSFNGGQTYRTYSVRLYCSCMTRPAMDSCLVREWYEKEAVLLTAPQVEKRKGEHVGPGHKHSLGC